MTEALTDRLAAIVGTNYVSTDSDVLEGRSVDYTGRYRGQASVLVRPGSTDEVGEVLRACRDAGVCVTVQGGRTSLVAGAVPEHDDVLLSTERLREVDEVDIAERRVHVGAGVTLAEVQRVATAAGLVFGVDLAARDTATVGGMASTNAGGLRTVCFGNMGEQVIGLDVALPDGSVVHRHSQVRSDNTGYDLASLFVGAEGTLGVITGLDLRLHPAPTPTRHRHLRIRRSGRAHRGRAGVPRHGRHRRAGADRRPRERPDRRACRGCRAGGRCVAVADRTRRGHRPDRAARRRAGGRRAVRRAGRRRRRQRSATTVAGARVGRRRARRLRPPAEIRCLAAAFIDPGVRRRRHRATGRTRSRRDPGAVRAHRRRQPAPQRGAL